jgi:hypothetical protein
MPARRGERASKAAWMKVLKKLKLSLPISRKTNDQGGVAYSEVLDGKPFAS